MANYKKVFTKKETMSLLSKLDDQLEKDGIQRRFKMYGTGGTKMVLSDLRHSSEDVDFVVSERDFRTLSSYSAEMEWREGIRFDNFRGSQFPGYKYLAIQDHAKKVAISFKHIDLYLVDDVDFVLTKALAGRDKDIQDIKVMLGKTDVPKEELVKRLKTIEFDPEHEKELRKRFDQFLETFYK